MLCLTIRLHSHSAIYFSILFQMFILFPPHLFDCSCIDQFIHCIVYCCLFVYHVSCYLVSWPQNWINTTRLLLYNTWLSEPVTCLDVNDANNDSDDYDNDDDDDSDDNHNHNDDNRCLCTSTHNVRVLHSLPTLYSS